MKPIWIELVDKGIANRFELEDCELIEVNWRLSKYPKLYKNILEHELHHESGNYKLKDFLHDMNSKTPGLFKFMRENPSSWIQILPFYWDNRKKQLIYDISSIVSWGLIISLSVLVFFFLGGFK